MTAIYLRKKIILIVFTPIRGMDLKLTGVTLALGIGLSIILALAFRDSIASSWDDSRCKPGVIALAALFKPPTDPRSGAEFAKDNWHFCQKQYIETSLRVATSDLKSLSEAQGGLVSVTNAVVDGISNTFTSLWSMCHQAFAMFMDRFTAAAKLMRNMMINMYAMVDRLQGILFSVAMSLISLIMAMIDAVQVVLMVAIIIIGIILVMMILLFYLFAPISGLIMTVSVLVAISAVVATAAIAAATINDACFTGDTLVMTAFGPVPIRSVTCGDILFDGSIVEATHIFKREGPLYSLHGIKVSGNHLIYAPDLIPVRDHPFAIQIDSTEEYVYCLTTSSRRIPIKGSEIILFADWEEIPECDPALRSWYSRVFETLNGISPLTIPTLDSDAGISPDCYIKRKDSTLVQASAIKIGDELLDGVITGIVQLEGDLGPSGLANGTWTFHNGLWDIYQTSRTRRAPLIHFYTSSGTLTVGSVKIRDASEVGLHRINALVEELILNHKLG
jgi:hypothetical protein